MELELVVQVVVPILELVEQHNNLVVFGQKKGSLKDVERLMLTMFLAVEMVVTFAQAVVLFGVLLNLKPLKE